MIVDEFCIKYWHCNEMDKCGEHDPEFDNKIINSMRKLGFKLVSTAYADEGDGEIILEFST